jgi:mono/diheme cytochrome c family protein
VPLSLLLLCSAFGVPREVSANSNSTTTRVPFDEGVATIFRARCVRCHGPDEVSGGLRLDGYDALMRGGERGPVVVPGNVGASLLMLKVLRRDKPAMPPRKRLAPSEVRRIRSWIESGAEP